MSRNVRHRKYTFDWFRVFLMVVGTFLFIYGVRLAWVDASDDFHMGGWGVIGASLSGLGALLLYISRLV